MSIIKRLDLEGLDVYKENKDGKYEVYRQEIQFVGKLIE